MTSEDNVRCEEVVADLDKHVKMAHLLHVRLQENATKARQAEAAIHEEEAKKIHEETQKIIASTNAQQSSRESSPSSRGTDATAGSGTSNNRSRQQDKRDSLPRPTIEENSNVTDWTFFLIQWKRYVLATNLSEPQQIHHLWAACSAQLQRSLHMGADSVTDPRTLLENVRLLAVKRKNNLVHIVEFQRMGQNDSETITQFTTHLQGQASICDLTVECPDCEKQVSFREKFIMYQFIRGLQDTNAQEKILETAAQVEGGEPSLIRVLKLAEAAKMVKANQKFLNQGGELSKLSKYQANKRNSRQDTRSQSVASKDIKCGNCGKSNHTSKLNDRRKNCPAFDKNCSKCQTNGHFASQCRGGPRSSRPDRLKSKDNK